MSAASAYAGRLASLLTLHGKERVVAPSMRDGLGMELTVDAGFDTDALGTFTREVAREGSQRETALVKARLASCRSGDLPGVGSEGSFVAGPFGLGMWNIEMVAFFDPSTGLEVVGQASGPARCVGELVTTPEALASLAARAGFPEQGLVLRAGDVGAPVVAKGLDDWGALERHFLERLPHHPAGLWVESDLRAHCSPTRMEVIARATDDLVARLLVRCSACQRPGFGKSGPIRGLPCADCGHPTDLPRADLFACAACPHTETIPRPMTSLADPGSCPCCNP